MVQTMASGAMLEMMEVEWMSISVPPPVSSSMALVMLPPASWSLLMMLMVMRPLVSSSMSSLKRLAERVSLP